MSQSMGSGLITIADYEKNNLELKKTIGELIARIDNLTNLYSELSKPADTVVAKRSYTSPFNGSTPTVIVRGNKNFGRGLVAFVTLTDLSDPSLHRTDIVVGSTAPADWYAASAYIDRECASAASSYTGQGVIDTVTTPEKDIVPRYFLRNYFPFSDECDLIVYTNPRQAKLTATAIYWTV